MAARTAEDIQARLQTMSPREQLRLKLRMYQTSLPLYASEVLTGPQEYEFKFILGPHHMEWGAMVNRESRILALAARDHGKSHYWCFAYPIWQAHIRNPGREGYIVSATDEQAKDHLRKIRAEVVSNPKLASLLPLKKDDERHIIFANGSSIKARGFGSKVRGGHPYWIVGDDMLNDEHVWSETVRGKALDYFLSAIEPMVVPGGQLIVVGTPFHALDLYNFLEAQGVYKTIKHPALDPITGRALWPARYDEAALALKKRILGSALRWSREYLCVPISDDSSIFPPALFDAPGIKRPYVLGLPGEHWASLGWSVYIGVDLAISASANADYFVAFVLAQDHEGNLWVVDIRRGQGLGYQEQVDTIVSLAMSYDAQFVFVESNQFQRVITDMVIRDTAVPIKAFYTTGRGGSRQATAQRRGIAGTYSANKNALDRGVPGLRMRLENRKIRIPWGDEHSREMIGLWIAEMAAYSFVQGKLQGVGAHDDTVMAFWMAERAADLGGGFGVWFGDEDGDNQSTAPNDDPETWTSAAPRRMAPPTPEDDDVEPDFFGIGRGSW